MQDAHIPHDPAQDPAGPEPTEQPDRQAQPVDHEQPPKLPFPVVGIGASAGGLEAVTELITAMRPDSGMAFVFIQHLPPEHESHIADILAKKTSMLVQQVQEGMKIERDHVYVIRPGNVLTMPDGRFHLGPQLGKRAANRPVDDFFKSLAEEQRERGIGVILSGMGSNGTAGAQAIKAVGGLMIAQDPETTAYPSMPRHLIDQGYADYILAPGDMPEILLQYAGHPYARADRDGAEKQLRRDANHLREILALLRTRARTDFNGYKKPTILRRVQRRMGLARLTDMGEYARLVRQSPSEATSLADDLLIHVTGFFRDTSAWEAMHQRVIVPLVAEREPGSQVRAWVTACSSGEEAYTLAMLLLEEAERAGKALGIKVFATDMATRPLQQARAGIFPGGIESEVDPQRLEKFFEKVDSVYRIKPHLRECVVFAPQDVLEDPPFSKLDIVSCRNLLIYLEPEVQQRVLSLLHFGLREGGALFLGSSETVGAAEGMYDVIDKQSRIFRRVGPTRRGLMDFVLPRLHRGDPNARRKSAEFQPPELRGAGRSSIGSLTARTLLEKHIHAAVTVNRGNNIVYFHGNTRAFLEQPVGEPTGDLFQLAREELRGPIRVALHRCAAENEIVTVLDGRIKNGPDKQARVAITVSPLWSDDGANTDYFVVSFEQMEAHEGDPLAAEVDPDLAAGQLRSIRDELETTIEQLQSSNEELKTSNEEVISINEELQSTNEELETSKEEMQSLNEELVTINAQLQVKIDESQTANNDLTALIGSTDIGVLFLDMNFAIRRYTSAVSELIDLIPGDVGRPLANLRRKFDDPQLDSDAREVLQKLAPIERVVVGANGKIYARRVLPYRTTDNRIDGVVITFVDITERTLAQRALADLHGFSEAIVETLHEPLLVLGHDLTVKSANPAFYEHFEVTPAQTIGRKIYDLGNGQWNIPALRQLLEEVLPQKKVFNDYEVIHEFNDLGRRVMLLNARRLDSQQLILLGVRDVTEKHAAEQIVRAGSERLARLTKIGGVGVLIFEEASGKLREANDAFLEMTGYTRAQVTSGQLNWRSLTPPEYLETSERQMEQYRQTGRIGPYEKEYFRADGSRSWMLFAGAGLGDGTIAEYCIDISGWKNFEEQLRESEQQLRLVMDNVQDYAILTADPKGIVTSWNPGALRTFQYSPDEIIGRNAEVLFTPEDRAAGEHDKELEEAARTGRASDDRWQMRKDGSRFWASGVSSAIRDVDNRLLGFVKILRDETPRKELEERLRTSNEALEKRVGERTSTLAAHQRQLRSLVAELTRAETRQRRLLATELHDNLAQLLAVCKMRISSLEARGFTDADARKEAGAVKDALGEAISYTRALMTDLRPDVLDEHDLPAAIEWVAKRMARHGLKVTVEDDGEPKPLHEEVLGFLFQAVRELLWNVVKHARTTEATVSIERIDHTVRLTVEDRGVGFNPTDRTALPTEVGGFGLFSIAERIDLLGGELKVESTPRRGTRATVTAPLDPQSEKPAPAE